MSSDVPIPINADNAVKPIEQVTSALTAPSNISLIMDSIIIDPSILPFQLAEGAVIDKASEQERDRLKKLLSQIIGSGYGTERRFECHVQTVTEGAATRWVFEELPEEEWRYYVIRTDDNGSKNIDLGQVSAISQACLEFQSLSLSNGGHGFRSSTLVNLFHFELPEPSKHITEADLSEIALLYALKLEVVGSVSQPSAPYPEIGRALQMLDNVRMLPQHSEFQVLGLFAIIEMLITHNPKLEDRGDSITHQMKAKLPLLSNRFDRPLPYQRYFGQASSNTIWSALYGYRSTVAHGGMANFSSGQLQCLKDRRNADSFLFLTVQSLIRHSLREPQLYRDIKEC